MRGNLQPSNPVIASAKALGHCCIASGLGVGGVTCNIVGGLTGAFWFITCGLCCNAKFGLEMSQDIYGWSKDLCFEPAKNHMTKAADNLTKSGVFKCCEAKSTAPSVQTMIDDLAADQAYQSFGSNSINLTQLKKK